MEQYIQIFLENPTAQIIGLIAFGVDVVALGSTNDKRFKWLLALACALLGVHFMLLEAYAGACIMVINSTRFALSVHANARRFSLLYISLYAVVGGLSYGTFIDIFPIASGVTATIAVFYFAGIKMRSLLILCGMFWLVHNVAQHSIGGVLMEIVFIALNIYTIRKLYREDKAKIVGYDS